ncbi:MAG: DHH family phosphoesterase [Butyrivibrio sp.]|nr:DHH family phosphoesterase [Butyrivibrio sp.]
MNSPLGKMKGALKAYMLWPMFAAVFFALVNVGVYFISIRAAVVLTVALLMYLLALIIFILLKRNFFIKGIIDFASGYAQMQKKMIDDFVVPYGLLDGDGKIIWLNNAFAEIVSKDSYHRTLSSIFPETEEMKLEQVIMGANIETHLVYNGRNYRLTIEAVDTEGISRDTGFMITDSNAKLFAVYLFDETEITECRRELHDERGVVGLIYIDNFDEALDSIDEVRRSLLMALVDRKINKYISGGNGIVKKLEKDKYLVVFRYKYLEQLREDRFSVLEDVKSVNIGNEMSVTLSIGIGAQNGSFMNNYDMARAAIDLALGRGGDQTVVREGSKVTYYGGKTNSVEKNTRVKARVKAHALRELLEATDNVLIMGHKISDVDAVGAAVGIYAAARVFDKKANIVLNDVTTSLQPIVDLYKNSSDYDKDFFVTSDEALTKVTANTLLVIVDVNRRSYTECPELIGKCKTTVVFDHHRQGSEPVENATLSYIEPYASSACEMVAEILQYICDNIRIRPIEADTIYAGIVIDTNNFTNKAGARTFEAAAFVRRSGADIVRVRKLLRSDMTEYKAKAEAVRHSEVYRDNYAISICPSAGLQSPTIVGAQAANELLNISGIKASFVLTYYNNEIYISARSIDEVNVQLIMEKLGGGGHMTIAGAQLKDMDMEEAITLIKDTLTQMIQEGSI